MRIGIIIGRIGGIDGVALETEKWLTVLRRLGHEVFIITGKLDDAFPNATVIPAMHFHHPQTIREQNEAFFGEEADETELLERIEKDAEAMAMRFVRWIKARKLDLIISQNASALPCHLTLGLAVKKTLQKVGIPAIAHDHDFHWERGDRYVSCFTGINDLVHDVFPTRLEGVQHVVINTAAKNELKSRFNIDATIVPNVMDFSRAYTKNDRYNHEFRSDFGFTEEDILLFQVTRIVRRKGIETAIDLIKELSDPKYKLIITGTSRDDENCEYTKELQAKIDGLHIASQVYFLGNRFCRERAHNHAKEKIYSIPDAYAICNATTYFSTYEGFGNAFVEAVVSKKPIFVNNYKPVYWPDIGSKGFEAVMLEEGQLNQKAVNDIKFILENPARIKEIVEHNFQIGKMYFSYKVLEQKLVALIDGVQVPNAKKRKPTSQRNAIEQAKEVS